MILVAPTSFKGTHSASAVTQAMVRAVHACGKRALSCPVSDGGPGLIDALISAQGGETRELPVRGPVGDPVIARMLVQSARVIIESADACGLHLVPREKQNPLETTSYGVGQLLLAAARYQREIIVGLGGSATVDAGLGMAEALGFELRGSRGLLKGNGAALSLLKEIKRTHRITLPTVVALADVRNVLLGSLGAARVFGPQKGASAEQVEQLERGMEHTAAVLRRDLGSDVEELTSGGAAGGLAAGLMAFAGARVVSGSEWVLRALNIDELLQDCELVITGEGAFDVQSGMGKITGELIAKAQCADVPVLLVAGSVSGNLPSDVHVVSGSGRLELSDIERLVRAALERLLGP